MRNLSVVDFGKKLIQTGDLDPVYIALHFSDMPLKMKQRWCVAYWMFYHAGLASILSESTDFWGDIKKNFKTVPRGVERRHFRGPLVLAYAILFGEKYPIPEKFVDYVSCKPLYNPQMHKVCERVIEHKMFGPWIAFKIADMLDRVLDCPVKFDSNDVLRFYSEPREGAELAAKELDLPTATAALQHLLSALEDSKAPPSYDRRVNIQEAETILCKWKAYKNGHYYIGKDLHDIAHALKIFNCKTSRTLLEALYDHTVDPTVRLV